MVYEHVPTALWLEDLSRCRRRIQRWQRQGMTDLAARLAAYPAAIDELLGLARVIDVNQATLDRYGYADRDELVASLDRVYSERTRAMYGELFAALLAGETTYSGEDVNLSKSGERVVTLVTFSVVPGHEEAWDLLICSDVDISQQKAAEQIAALQRDIVMGVGGSDDVAQALGRLLDLLGSLDLVDIAWIHLHDPATGEFRLTASRGMSAETARRIESYPARSARVRSLRGGVPAYGPYRELVNPPGRRPEEIPTELAGLSAAARLPLLHEDELLGVLAVGSRSCDRFPSHTRRLLELAATEVGGVLARVSAQQELRRSEASTRALLNATRAISSSLDYDEVLQAIARQAGEALDSAECVIWEYLADSDEELLRTYYQRAPNEELAAELVGSRYSLDEYPDDRRMILAGMVVQESVSDPEMAPALREAMQRWGEKTALSVPLRADGEPLGLMVLIETERERDFTQEERELASALGEQAAGAMRNARLYQTVQAQLKVRHDLLTLSESLLSTLDGESVFGHVASTLHSLVAYDSLTIGVVDGAAGELHILFADGREAEALRDRRLPCDRGVTGAVLQAGTAELVNDMLRDPRAYQIPGTEVDEQASILAPIRLGARTGVLTIDRYGGAHFERDDLETVQLFASIAAVALENANLYRIAEQQAISDGLTGLYNHRHFYERLGMELARARRSGQPLALLMIDLDDFKQLNDEHGHPAGDEVLRTVGRILSEGTRRGVDLPARYGGEEFAVFLPDTAAGPDTTPGEGAAAVAERLRAAVEQARIEYGEGDARLELHTTISIGLAVFPATAGTMGELVAQADAALYLAKRRGKNRVEAYGLK